MSGAVACPGSGVSFRMDAVFCMPFFPMVNVSSLTRAVGKSPVFFGITLLYVFEVILSPPVAEEAASGSLLMYISCPGVNSRIPLAFLSYSGLYRRCVEVRLVSACECKTLTRASSFSRKAWSFVGYYVSDERIGASSKVSGPGGLRNRTRMNGVVLADMSTCLLCA